MIIYCNGATGLLKEQSYPENPDEWRRFINTSKLSMKAGYN